MFCFYRLFQLRLQADESDVLKRDFEKTKNDLIKQFSEIVLEKNNLEKEVSYFQCFDFGTESLPFLLQSWYLKESNQTFC